jgi:hypothetical protein
MLKVEQRIDSGQLRMRDEVRHAVPSHTCPWLGAAELGHVLLRTVRAGACMQLARKLAGLGFRPAGVHPEEREAGGASAGGTGVVPPAVAAPGG